LTPRKCGTTVAPLTTPASGYRGTCQAYFVGQSEDQSQHVEAKSDTSLFVYHRGTDTAYLSLYVDDIVLTASSPELLQHTTTTLFVSLLSWLFQPKNIRSQKQKQTTNFSIGFLNAEKQASKKMN
jgi:hypothetical protein